MHGMLGVAHDVDAVVIVEHEDVGDDRRRHQDDMRGGRHIGHGSRLGHGGCRQGRRHSVDCGVGRVCATTAFATKPYLMDMYHILVQRALSKRRSKEYGVQLYSCRIHEAFCL